MPCHSDSVGSNWPLTTYDDVAGWADVIASDVVTCTMPPADGGVPITEHDRITLVNWFVCGNPQ